MKYPFDTAAAALLTSRGFPATDQGCRSAQALSGVTVDGDCGPQTTAALEKWPLAKVRAWTPTDGARQKQMGWPARLQSALDVCVGSGRVGYATPHQSGPHVLKEPIADRYSAERITTGKNGVDEATPAWSTYGTLNTWGGCGSFADRLIALTVGDGTPHYAWNQTSPTLPESIRAEQFKQYGDNMPSAVLDGEVVLKTSWTMYLEGYADLFDQPYRRLDGAKLAKFEAAPLYLIHVQGGHVITALTVCYAKGWAFEDPRNPGYHMPDGVYRFGADGGSKLVGQPTTLSRWGWREKDSLRLDYVWPLARPGELVGAVDVYARLQAAP